MIGGASVTTRLTKRRQVEEGSEYRQILPSVEVIMKNEKDRQSLGNNKAHKKAAAGGRQRVPTDATKSSGWGKVASTARSSHQQRSLLKICIICTGWEATRLTKR